MSEELIAAVIEAKGRAYAPYSHFTVGYDSASGRIASADIGGIAHTWSYLEGSDLKSRLDYGTIGSAEWSYEPNRDLLTQVRNSAHGSVISQYDYTNDAAGRRVSKNNELYGYNERSELISAVGNGNYSYTYDDIGNRITSSEPENSFAYTANSLNQYTEISDVNLNLQPQPFVPEYDLDGNQTLIKTKTGIWSVLYNGENRPIDWTCGATNIVMKYDRMGRRVEYLETFADDTAVATNKHQRFVYDNYLCVERHSVTNDTTSLTDVFVWDPTEPVATRPLQWQTSSDTYLYFHDGNKNVSDVMSGTSTTSAMHYNYTPFGVCELDEDVFSSINPWRFSSEYADIVLRLQYYNNRHFDCRLAKWIVRDRQEELAGYNLYAFVRNAPTCLTDMLGDAISLQQCNQWLDRLLGAPPDLDVLSLQLSLQIYGCPSPRPRCVCDPENSAMGGHNTRTSDITINAATATSFSSFKGTLLHELQHRVDKCKAGEDYDTSCEAIARREVRAYLRSGKYGYYKGVGSRINWQQVEKVTSASLRSISKCKANADRLARAAVQNAMNDGEVL